MIASMTRHKFGINNDTQMIEEKLLAFTIEQLEELAEALLELSEVAALNKWLATSSGICD